MFQRVLLLTAVAGCSSSASRTAPKTEAPPPSTTATDTRTCDRVVVMEDGRELGAVCEDEVGKDKTIVDLRDAWTPRLFAPAADGSVPAFRETYLQLALERDATGKPLPPTKGLTELYGVVPSFAIVRARFAQSARHACHAKLAGAPGAALMGKLARPYGEEHAGLVRHNIHQRKLLAARLEPARAARNAVDYSVFAGDRELGPIYERWKTHDELVAGIEAAQRHLHCEGVLAEKHIDGAFTWEMGMALELFQRRHFLIPNSRLDPETRAALAEDPRELDFRFALRVLRERVVDATGLIEDGTAGAGPLPILGRRLDPEAMRGARGYGKALPNGAPDLISPATEAAAKQLGWTSPATAAAFLARHPAGTRVALALPAPPAYHATHMELHAEIDRGDVWYDDTPRVSWRRPSMTLFVKDGTVKRPLVRWATTIGGWSDVNIGGAIVKRWKESDVGPRQWRELYAAPTWLPPASTPDQELVKWLGPGKWELKRSIMGPGPMAAFGMMLLPHHAVVKRADGRTVIANNGIGTHGSAVVTSIMNGTSHGCHRLYNQLAVRLGAFLLAHRTHAVKGQVKQHYRRMVHAGGKHLAKIDTRGYLYELTPPVPVDVLPGNIRSERKIPPAGAVAAGAE